MTLPTRDEAIAKAHADYEAALGTEIKPNLVMANVDTHTCEFATGGTITVRVIKTDADSVVHINDNFVDPYWDVEVVSDPEGRLKDVDAFFWIDGPSHEFRL
jgi:hypothetical protein